MKRLFSIVALTLLLLHVAGFYVYFVVRLKAIHAEQRAAIKNLPEEQLTRFLLDRTEYEAAKVGNDELKWAGKMYDIAQLEWVQNKVLILALQDADEDNLISFIKKVVSNAEHDNQQAPTVLTCFFMLVYISPAECRPTMFTHEVSNPTPRFSFINFSSISLPIDSPPPQA